MPKKINEEKRPVRVAFLPHARDTRADAGDTVEDAARRAGSPLDAPCEGRGLCGGCRVRVLEGAPEPTAWDRLHIGPDDLATGVRLGCVARLERDAIVSRPPRPEVLLDGRGYGWRLAPRSQRARVRAAEADATGELAGILPTVALGETARELTLHTIGTKLRKVELGVARSRRLGVAVALYGGTLQGWLLDLATGEEEAAGAASVIGASDRAGATPERTAAAARRLARSLCGSGARVEDVHDLVVVGAPLPGDREAAGMRSPGAGHDPLTDLACSAVAAAGGPDRGPSLLLSLESAPWALYTDGERGWLAAAPAAPYRPGLFAPAGDPGAIRRVAVASGVALEPDGGAPTGLSLGGALDCASELRRLGLLDRRGRLATAGDAPAGLPPELLERLAGPGEAPHFRLWGVGEHAVTLTHAHVRALQRLRATLSAVQTQALGAGASAPGDLERVALVGPEAANLRVVSAVALGVLPDAPASLVQPLPDALGVASRLALLSSEADRAIRELAKGCERLPAPALGRGWAEGLYLELLERPSRLDAEPTPLLDFQGRGSVGIGRRA